MAERHDLVVLGGGLTGLALAAAVGSAGFSVALVEQLPIPTLLSAPFDGRVTAIALGSQRFLAAVGVWDHLGGAAQPIRAIEVRERSSPLRVRYDHHEVGDEPLGFIVENRDLRRALIERIRELPGVRLLAPARALDLAEGPGGITLQLADGSALRASLLAVCEGRGSAMRERLGIRVKTSAYAQTGIVCTLAHDHPHGGLAIERFFPDGPFARLPMTGNRSSIVWALDDRLAREVTALDDRGFLGEVAERLGDELGELRLDGPRWHYPLQLAQAERYVAGRAALLGDAARSIHPIAGQGWNLAVRDVAALAEIVVDRLRLGLDPGEATALDRYAAWRRFDGMALVAVTDGINRLFANDLFPVRAAREAGLGLVERLPPLKRFFMRHAMGLLGELPRAMRGLPL